MNLVDKPILLKLAFSCAPWTVMRMQHQMMSGTRVNVIASPMLFLATSNGGGLLLCGKLVGYKDKVREELLATVSLPIMAACP